MLDLLPSVIFMFLQFFYHILNNNLDKLIFYYTSLYII